jgi:hypothetical protein
VSLLMWRSTHEALVAEKDRAIADLRAEKRQLLKLVLRLKAQGATLTPKPGTVIAAPVDPLDTLLEEVADRFAPSGPARSQALRHLRKHVAGLRSQGLDDDTIRERILAGEPAE